MNKEPIVVTVKGGKPGEADAIGVVFKMLLDEALPNTDVQLVDAVGNTVTHERINDLYADIMRAVNGADSHDLNVQAYGSMIRIETVQTGYPVVLTELDTPIERMGGLVVSTVEMTVALENLNRRLQRSGGKLPVELGMSARRLFETNYDFANRVINEVDQQQVCGYLTDIRIEGTQVVAIFTPDGPQGDVIKALHYPTVFEFGLRCCIGMGFDNVRQFKPPFTWSVVEAAK